MHRTSPYRHRPRPTSGGTSRTRLLLHVAAAVATVALTAAACTGADDTSTTRAATVGTAAVKGDAPEADTLVRLSYPLDGMDEVLTSELPGATIVYDGAESSDGGGSLKITAEQPVTVPLVETGDLDIEDATLFYRAKLRSEDLDGRAYLEMWCMFTNLGQYFSRGLDQPVAGTTDWTTVQTPFYLKADQNPDNVKLNVVVEGAGTVWVDDLELYGVATAQ